MNKLCMVQCSTTTISLERVLPICATIFSFEGLSYMDHSMGLAIEDVHSFNQVTQSVTIC